jgi:hypothetical protein
MEMTDRIGDKRRFGDIAIELRYINDDAIKRYVDYMEKGPRSVPSSG